MNTRRATSRRAFVASLCGMGFAMSFAVAAHAETEAERKVKLQRQAKSTAWIMGISLARAALMHATKVEAEYKKYFAFADRAAAFLGIDLKPFPATFAPPELVNVIKYLDSEGGVIYASITKRYSADHGELFEAGMKSTLAGLFPWQANQTPAVADGLKSRYQRLGLPSNLWTEFVTAVSSGKSLEERDKRLREMQVAVMAHLDANG